MVAAPVSNSSVLPMKVVMTAHSANTAPMDVSSQVTASDDTAMMAAHSANTAPVEVSLRNTAIGGSASPAHFSSNSVSMMDLSSRNADSDGNKIATQSSSSSANASHMAVIVGEEVLLLCSI